jgi:hypothetical protein
MKSIAFMAMALLVGLGHRGNAASLLPEHMASTVENSAEVATLGQQLPISGAYLNRANRSRPNMTARYGCCGPKGTLIAS